MAKCKNCKGYDKTFAENELAVGHWCDFVDDDPDAELERDCKYYQAMTNADRIRAMTDEELAGVIPCPNNVRNCIPEGQCEESIDCYKCTMKWLQLESEE